MIFIALVSMLVIGATPWAPCEIRWPRETSVADCKRQEIAEDYCAAGYVLTAVDYADDRGLLCKEPEE